MATRKFIYWRSDVTPNKEGQSFANIHILVTYNQGTITDYQEMASELRKTFPDATDTKIRGGKVFKDDSGCCHGATIIAYDAFIPQGEYPGWHQPKDSRPEYFW